MKKVTKAMAAIMLMTAMIFTVGCNNSTSNSGGKNGSTTENNASSGDKDSNNDHDYVDLGLPSGTLWATCNVGASKPEDYGDYFAWGETKSKTIYDLDGYKYCNGGNYLKLTKYCNKSSYGYNGFTDNFIVLQPGDDVVTANWGADWCMPTEDQWRELENNTTNTLTTQNGVSGRLFTASNGNSLFLPAAGSRWDDEFDGVGDHGDYWSSTLNTRDPDRAWCLGFGWDYCCVVGNRGRYDGHSVRAVRSAHQN